MKYNEIIGRIAEKIKYLGTLKTNQLRMEHPDANNCEIVTISSAKKATQGLSREEIIADIILEVFSEEIDFDLEFNS